MNPVGQERLSQRQIKNPPSQTYRVNLRPGLTIDLFVVFSVVVGLLIGWLTIRYLDAAHATSVTLLLVTEFTVLANLLLYHHRPGIAVNVLQAIFFLMTTWFFLSGGIDQNGWFWLIPYSFVTFFLKGYKAGQQWNVVLAGVVTVTTIAHGVGVVILPYPPQTIFMYLVLYYFMLSLAFLRSLQSHHQLQVIRAETDREQQLEKEYEKFKLAVDQVSEQIVITDPDGIIIYANHATEEITGYAIEEIIGKKAGAKQLWGGRMDQAYYEKLWKTIKHEQKTFSNEIQNQRKNGQSYYSWITISPVLDRHQQVVYYVAIEKDVSDEKKLNRILARDEAILFNVGDGLVATDKEGKITVVNRAAEWLLGKSAKSLVGQLFIQAIPAQDANHRPMNPAERLVMKFITGALPISIPPRVKQYYQRNDGVWFPVITTVAPIIMDGAVTGVVSVFHDISHEEAIEKTKTEFISVASHQLQTPLSAIGWLTELLEDNIAGKLTARQKEVIKKIEKSNKRMVDIVNSLLNSSRAELGSFIITPEKTDLIALTKEMVDEARVKPVHRVTFIEDYSLNFPSVAVDPLLFRMIVQNLLSNALRYTPNDGRITVRLTHDPQNFTLEVSDTGIGIPPGSQELIYLKFYRAPNAARLEPEGIGLGMYLVKSIIDASGGAITFTSIENKGTTFQVSFPITGMKEKSGSRHLTLSGATPSPES